MTLLANSEAAVWTAMLGGKLRSKPRCLIGFWASSGLIVDFANSVVLWRHPSQEIAFSTTHLTVPRPEPCSSSRRPKRPPATISRPSHRLGGANGHLSAGPGRHRLGTAPRSLGRREQP